MWKCQCCETVNEKEKCIICGRMLSIQTKEALNNRPKTQEIRTVYAPAKKVENKTNKSSWVVVGIIVYIIVIILVTYLHEHS